jgi:hypothetical protein
MDAVGASIVASRQLRADGWLEYADTWPDGPVPRIVWEPLSLQYDAEAQQGGGDETGQAIAGMAVRVALHIWAESTDYAITLLIAACRAMFETLDASWRLVSGAWATAALDQDRAAYGRALVGEFDLLLPVPRLGDAAVTVETTSHECSIDVPGGSGPEAGC